MAGQPYSKTQQLARGDRRYHRRVASPKTWQRIADAKQGPCRVCGVPPSNELHHVVPRAIGGFDVEANIVPLCADCHRLIEDGDTDARRTLRAALTDTETAYAVGTLGVDRFDARYPA